MAAGEQRRLAGTVHRAGTGGLAGAGGAARPDVGYAAIILAGGAGRRLGGPDKPTLVVGGRRLLDAVLDAVTDADPRILVGPDSLWSAARPAAGVERVLEAPPGGGPVAGLAAGLARLIDSPAGERGGQASDLRRYSADFVAVLAADLPFLTGAAVGRLRDALLLDSTVDGAVYVDGDGRRQTLCGMWRVGPLQAALDRLTATGLAGARMRDLLAGLRTAEVRHQEAGPPPWYDCDEPDDLIEARKWAEADS
jgi:molybdenum cofactor guanylyltransferase